VRLNSHGSGKGILPPVLVQRARHQEKKQGSCQFAPDGEVCHDWNTTGGGGLQTPTANRVTIGDDNRLWSAIRSGLLTNTSGNNYHLDALAGPATGPATLIIGPGPYTNANGSITDNDPHNPFIDPSATWTLAFAGATASTVISNVVFSFGKQPGANVAVPIPAAVWLFGSGLLGLVAIARRRQGGVMRGSLAAT